MPSQVEKQTLDHGLLLATEASYGAGGSLAGTDDAVLVEEPVEIVPSYAGSGERGPSVGRGGPWQKAPPVGRFAEGFTIPVLVRGADEAYSSSIFPSDIHVPLRISGHDVSTDSSAGTESQTYTPTVDASSYASGVVESYTRGELQTVEGVLGSLSMEFEDSGFLRADVECSGLVTTDPTDASVPSLTLDTHQPPKGENLQLSVGNLTAGRIRSLTFNQNRAIGPRLDRNASDAHGGFHGGAIDPELQVEIEATALSTASPPHEASSIDPYELYALATVLEVSFTIGSTQYNRMTFTASQAQISAEPEKGEDAEGVALWTLTFQLGQSSPGAGDWYTITFD